MDEIEFIEDDTIEKMEAMEDFPDSGDEDDVIAIDDEPAVVEDDRAEAGEAHSDDLKPLPNMDDSEVIELDDMDPIEIEELDDMAEIANMATHAQSAEPQRVTAQATPDPIEVPITVNLPAALAGKPLRLQIDISFQE
jgi:hypothetical protein